ncbi:glycogen synthase (plasmid) [Streptomyces sp. NBC_00715]|uniref:glycogen synthase n=1 Tax=Streptomyces sp. NBC_00715 TaxID=2975811 RepID=UPI002F914FF2
MSSPDALMRVDLLTREFPPDVYGGAGVHAGALAAHLRDVVDLRVHHFGGGANQSPAHAHSVPADLAAANPSLQALSVNASMAHQVAGAEVVHSHTWYANFAGRLAQQLHGIPHVVTAHSLEPLRPWKAEQLGGGYEISCYMEREALRRADRIIAVSRAMARDITEAYPEIDSSRIVVVPNGVDSAQYTPDHGTDALEAHGIGTDRPLVVCVARISHQKGLPYLLEAARHFVPGSRLVVVAQSADSPADRDAFAAAIDGLQRSGIDARWVGGVFPKRSLVQLLSHARAFVCPSIYEPLGIVNLEAMACGTPVVATAVGGIPEVVLDGETGYLVPIPAEHDSIGTPEEPLVLAKELAVRVNALLEDTGSADRMGRAARQRAVSHFSWSHVARQVAEVYRSVIR